jgi:HEAT repeat protein
MDAMSTSRKGKRVAVVTVAVGVVVLGVAGYVFRKPLQQEYWLYRLEHGDEEVKSIAVEALGRVGSSRSLGPLLEYLAVLDAAVYNPEEPNDVDTSVMTKAEAMLEIGCEATEAVSQDSPEEVVRILEGPRCKTRETLIAYSADFLSEGLQETDQVLIARLFKAIAKDEEEHERTRWAAIKAIRFIAVPSDKIEFLTDLSLSLTGDLQLTALVGLGFLQQEAKPAASRLLPLLQEGGEVAYYTALTLSRIAPATQGIAPILVDAWRRGEADRTDVGYALRRVGAPALPCLLAVVHGNTDEKQMAWVSMVLFEMGESVVPDLTQRLLAKGTDSQERLVLCLPLALRATNSDAAFEALLAALSHGEAALRLRVLAALGIVTGRDDPIREVLKTMIANDPSPKVRASALIVALAEGVQDIRAIAEKAAGDKEAVVRKAALEVLRRIESANALPR